MESMVLYFMAGCSGGLVVAFPVSMYLKRRIRCTVGGILCICMSAGALAGVAVANL